MNEPANHTAWIDQFGDTWVRVDEHPAPGDATFTWWPLTDGPGWEERVRDGVGTPRPWSWVTDDLYGPFAEADPERTARALARVREEAQ